VLPHPKVWPGAVVLGLVGTALVGTALAGLAAPAEAQWFRADHDVSTDLRIAGANMALGGVGAAIVAGLSGEAVGPAFLKGAAGGAVVYTGKRIAAERWYGAGLVGRQVGLLGGTMTRNGGMGRGFFDEVALGIGPVRWYRDLVHETTVWAVDVPAAGLLAWGLLDSRVRLDLNQTLSTGATVLASTSDREYPMDHALPGTIFASGIGSEERVSYARAHESVHILQFDQFHFLLGDPVERWVGSRLSARSLPVRLEFNAATLVTAAFLGLGVWTVHDDQPWEWEAIYLGRRR
jgi:hypothetical protein